MKIGVVVLGFLSATVLGLIAAFTVGEPAAIAVFVIVLGASVYAAVAGTSSFARRFAQIAGLLLVAGIAFVGWQAIVLAQALTGTSGPVDPADTVALASAHTKIEEVSSAGSFRLELTEDEIQAVIQDGLSTADSPLSRMRVDIVDGTDGGEGTLHFTGDFKQGNLSVEGVLSAVVQFGSVEIRVDSIDMGMLTLPGLAKNAIADLVESIADLNQAIAARRADVQSVHLGDGRLVITGTQATGDLLTSGDLLAGIAAQAEAASETITPPAERLGPGVVGTSADGPTYYVALGDSLAANVGVDDPRDGYVSRLHNQLQLNDGVTYGLRNFGVPGETTGTLIRTGQLDAAVAFVEANPVSYITIDIGANDLLGHLGSDDCSESLDAPPCAARLTASFAAYEENMVLILDRLRSAAPGATIVFMRAYNPFSLGFGTAVGLEAQSNETLRAFNDIAASIADARGILVADGFTPMLNTASATTHMLANPPDIHPTPIGYDILAVSILEAIEAANAG